MYLGKYDSSLVYYKKALSRSDRRDSSAISYIYFIISRVCDYKKMYREAYKNIVCSITYHRGKTDDESAFLYGDVLTKMNLKPDSARILFQKAYQSKDLYTKASGAAALYELEKKSGNREKAMAYNDTFLVLSDSIENRRDKKLATKVKQYELKAEKKVLAVYDFKKTIFLIGLLFFLLAITGIFFRKKVVEIILSKDNEIKRDVEKIRTIDGKLSAIEHRRKEEEIQKQHRMEVFMKNLDKKTAGFRNTEIYKEAERLPKKVNKTEFNTERLHNEIHNRFMEFYGFIDSYYNGNLSYDSFYYIILQYAGMGNNVLSILFKISETGIRLKKSHCRKKCPLLCVKEYLNEDFYTRFEDRETFFIFIHHKFLIINTLKIIHFGLVKRIIYLFQVL